MGSKYTIEWNGEQLSIKSKIGAMAIVFRDEKTGNRLGECRRRFSSILLPSMYDVVIFSNKIPDAIYLLGLVVYGYNLSKRRS
jgi:hypothetical protein